MVAKTDWADGQIVHGTDLNDLGTEVNTKAPSASPAFTGTPTGITKTHVGLGNVDNLQQQPIDSDLTAIAALTPTNDDFIQRKSGVWVNRTMAQLKTDLALTKTDVGLGSVDNLQQQPIDSDLTAIAALTPTNDDVVQRKSGAWTNRTMAQIKTDLALTKTDVGLSNVTNNAQYFPGGTDVAVADGGTGASTGSDARANLTGFTTTATAAGTTTLTVSSTMVQVFTGVTTQIVKLPTTSVPQGDSRLIINQSTGAVTVQSSGSNTIVILDAGTSGLFTAVIATPTTAANWDSRYWAGLVASGKSLTVSNTLTLAGTDSTTMTFPGSSATLAGLAIAQTLSATRLSPRVLVSNAPGATPTINVDLYDQINLTGIAANITSMTSGITGTPTAAQPLRLRFKDNGTARTIAWGASWRAVGVVLPATTVISKTLYVDAVYNSTDSLWDVVTVRFESTPGGSAAIITGGSMGATPALNVASAPYTQYTGTLTANATLTISNMVAGGWVVLELTQDATGGRTLAITGVTGTIPLDTTASAASAILVFSPDGSTLWVTGQRGPQGVSGTQTSGLWLPEDYGFKAWSCDPEPLTASNAVTAGTLYLIGIKIRQAMTITNLVTTIITADAGLTSGQCFGGLYQGGTLLAATADLSTSWNTTGNKTNALTSPQAVTAGHVYMAFYVKGNTTLAFLRGISNNVMNFGLSSGGYRHATADTGLTTTIPSTLGTQTQSTISLWGALS